METDLRRSGLAGKSKHAFQLSSLDIRRIPGLKARSMLKLLDDRMEGTVGVVRGSSL